MYKKYIYLNKIYFKNNHNYFRTLSDKDKSVMLTTRRIKVLSQMVDITMKEGRQTMIRSDSNYLKEENNLQEFSLDLSDVQSYN